MKLRFGKEWKEDILSLSKDEMFILFKSVCVRLCTTEKDLNDVKEQLSDVTEQLFDVEKELKEIKNVL
jgi:hypothetical protein